MSTKEELMELESNTRINVFNVGRSVYFIDEVNNHTIAEAFKIFQILESKNTKQPIRLIICSTGGDVYSGLALYDRIRISPCKVITVGTGMVASMGFIIFMAGEERVITPTTRLLHHQTSLSGSFRANDIKIENTEITRLEQVTNQIVASASGQPIKKIKEMIEKGDKYIYPAEALTDGYAHKMLPYVIHPKKIIKKGK